jgi:ABC-2 type transport system ATP-binding protein
MSAGPTAPGAVLEVEGLGVRYGSAFALEGITLSVAAGSVYALLGRNGAGKSSLVRCVLGQQHPQSGAVRLFGKDAWRSRRDAMKRVGVLPEEPDAPASMTAAQLSDLFHDLYDQWDATAVRARLERAGIPEGTPFGRLSKGQKGAVMLALCLGHGPEVLVLDDPTLGLDAVARHALYDELIGELADRGTSVLLTTHDLAGVESLADRVGILDGAHLVVDEPLDDLKSRFRRIRCASHEGDSSWSPLETVAATRREWGTEAIVSNFDEDRLERFRAAAAIGDVEVQSLSLEEIFLALVERREGRP